MPYFFSAHHRIHPRICHPLPAPLNPAELSSLGLPPHPSDSDPITEHYEHWSRLGGRVERWVDRDNGYGWGWSEIMVPCEDREEDHVEQEDVVVKALAVAKCGRHTAREGVQEEAGPGLSSRSSSAVWSDEPLSTRPNLSLSPTASFSLASTAPSTPSTSPKSRVRFLEPLKPTEDDDTDSLLCRLLSAQDTTWGWCTLVEKLLEFPLPTAFYSPSSSVTDGGPAPCTHWFQAASGSLPAHTRKAAWRSKQSISLYGLADEMDRGGELARSRSDPLLAMRHVGGGGEDEEPKSMEKVEERANRWWNLGDLLANP